MAKKIRKEQVTGWFSPEKVLTDEKRMEYFTRNCESILEEGEIVGVIYEVQNEIKEQKYYNINGDCLSYHPRKPSGVFSRGKEEYWTYLNFLTGNIKYSREDMQTMLDEGVLFETFEEYVEQRAKVAKEKRERGEKESNEALAEEVVRWVNTEITSWEQSKSNGSNWTYCLNGERVSPLVFGVIKDLRNLN